MILFSTAVDDITDVDLTDVDLTDVEFITDVDLTDVEFITDVDSTEDATNTMVKNICPYVRSLRLLLINPAKLCNHFI